MLLADISERSMRLCLAFASVFVSACSSTFVAKGPFESAPGQIPSAHRYEEQPPFDVSASAPALTASAGTSQVEHLQDNSDLVLKDSSLRQVVKERIGLKRKPKRADDEVDPFAPIASLLGGIFALFTFLAFTALAFDLITSCFLWRRACVSMR